ncbi:Valine--tRNA ligase [Ceratobasidium theobromae]|uniref:Valine--tRNA ligase n=1 Tax=Ceratobasidium theobromae TaxID=1582974 RepID=A0A5N5Q8R5_9AGAM|nr:Valine--tRNA ligase [Ceratobasidium theobromae]
MSLPTEIISEIVSYIAPDDLLIFVWINKHLRALFMRRSAAHIWQRVLNNVPGLPPCLSGMCEPQYVAFLFLNQCTFCGSHTDMQPDPYIRIKPCTTCRDNKLERVGNYWSNRGENLSYQGYLYSVTHLTRPTVLGKPSLHPYRYKQQFCLSEDVLEVSRMVDSFNRSEDKIGLEEWKENRQKTIKTWRQEGDRLCAYMDSESLRLTNERQRSVVLRLKTIGWKDNEMFFPTWSKDKSTWDSLIRDWKPLTDRAWATLLPKLETLLQANRDQILEYEKQARRSRRRIKLCQLLQQTFRNTPHPYQALVDALGFQDSVLIPSSTPYSSFFLSPFPAHSIALQWDILEQILTAEVSLEIVEERFNQCQEQLGDYISGWRADIQDRFMKQYFVGFEEERDVSSHVTVTVSLELPLRTRLTHFTFNIVQIRGSRELADRFPNDTRFLLRADVIFQPTSGHKPIATNISLDFLVQLRDPNLYLDINPETFERNVEFTTIAKLLLKDMGMQDVTYLELRSMGGSFACGRCGRCSLVYWDDVVTHYSKMRHEWNKCVIARSALAVRHPIPFRNLHDSQPEDTRPLVRILSAQEADTIRNSISNNTSSTGQSECFLCAVIKKRRCIPREDIMDHMRNVHNILDPIDGVHYGIHSSNDTRRDYIWADEWQRQWDMFHDSLISGTVWVGDQGDTLSLQSSIGTST